MHIAFASSFNLQGLVFAVEDPMLLDMHLLQRGICLKAFEPCNLQPGPSIAS